MIIAVDGPSAAGKGTLARRVAEHLDCAHLETGLLYRAVAAALLGDDADPGDTEAAVRAARTLDLDLLESASLRSDQVARAASVVAANPRVRAALVDLQRAFAASPPGGKRGAVLDGRDIGTVICPDADAKIFVTADVETRARRRHKELLDRGLDSIYARVLQEMIERDDRDRRRDVAPLKAAADAFILDTSTMDADAAFAETLAFLTSRSIERNG